MSELTAMFTLRYDSAHQQVLKFRHEHLPGRRMQTHLDAVIVVTTRDNCKLINCCSLSWACLWWDSEVMKLEMSMRRGSTTIRGTHPSCIIDQACTGRMSRGETGASTCAVGRAIPRRILHRRSRTPFDTPCATSSEPSGVSACISSRRY
jgi:hypothetical protein